MYAYLQFHRHGVHDREDIELILISETDHFVFVPMIHEVATGNLAPGSVKQPVRTAPQCCLTDFIQGAVYDVDFDTRTIRFTRVRGRGDGPIEEVMSYDYLLLALGSDTSFFGVPGAQEHTLTLKSLDDAIRIKNHIINQFERAQQLPENKRKDALHFVIVGGGATGVELAGELSDLINNELAAAFPDVHQQAKITLFEGGDTLLSRVDPWFGRRSVEILQKKGRTTVRYQARVTKVEESGVWVGEEFLPTETVLWTAGVRAQNLNMQAAREVVLQEHTDRIRVEDTLFVPEYRNVSVAGDMAWIENKETGQPYPMRAQFAVREGEVAARNILANINGKKPEPFHFQDQGFIVSLGVGGALAKVWGVKLSGPLAWWMYRTAYLFKILGVRAKLRTALEWTVNLFSPRDISQL